MNPRHVILALATALAGLLYAASQGYDLPYTCLWTFLPAALVLAAPSFRRPAARPAHTDDLGMGPAAHDEPCQIPPVRPDTPRPFTDDDVLGAVHHEEWRTAEKVREQMAKNLGRPTSSLLLSEISQRLNKLYDDGRIDRRRCDGMPEYGHIGNSHVTEEWYPTLPKANDPQRLTPA